MSIHVQHLTEDHCAYNRARREFCANPENHMSVAECEAECYDLPPEE